MTEWVPHTAYSLNFISLIRLLYSTLQVNDMLLYFVLTLYWHLELSLVKLITLTTVDCKSLYLAAMTGKCQSWWILQHLGCSHCHLLSVWVISELAEIWSFQWSWTSTSHSQNTPFPKVPQKFFVGNFLSYKDSCASCPLCFETVICYHALLHRLIVWDDRW